jgi:hypothetical protein
VSGHEYHQDCCPLLRYSAELERLVEIGLVMDGCFDVAQAIVIGRLRQQYGPLGCAGQAGSPGPVRGTPSGRPPSKSRKRCTSRGYTVAATTGARCTAR